LNISINLHAKASNIPLELGGGSSTRREEDQDNPFKIDHYANEFNYRPQEKLSPFLGQYTLIYYLSTL